MIIADLFNLVLLTPINSCPTRYSDMVEEANSVINLMFLWYRSTEINQHSIHPDCCLFSDYAPCQDHWWWTWILFSLFIFYFIFLFLEQLRLGSISHAVTSVTNWWRSHKTDYGTWENGVKGSGTKWRHTAWTIYAGLMLYSWSFRVGCTVASTDHE